MKISTTLNRIHDLKPCRADWNRLVAHLGPDHWEDEHVDIATILQCNGLDDALWVFAAEPTYWRDYRTLAIQFAWSEIGPLSDPSIGTCLVALEGIRDAAPSDEAFIKASKTLGNAPSWALQPAHEGVFSARWAVSNAVSEATLTRIMDAFLSSSVKLDAASLQWRDVSAWVH